MPRTYTLLTLGLIFLAPVASHAQEAPSSSVFQQLFPRPTGQNGYEEIVAAGEMLAGSKLLVEGEKQGLDALTLTQKRAVLADLPVHDALALFRQGLAKPLHAPRDKAQESALPAFHLYRRLARVLAMEQYADCADGRVGKAIDSLQDGLRLGYAVQSDTLIGGMVGVATDTLLIRAMQKHVDQLSESDCRRVAQLALAWIDAPDPAIEALGTERDQILKNMQGQFPESADFPRAQVLAGMKARLDFYIANLSKPAWDRKPAPALQGEKTVADYVNSLGQTLDPVFVGTQTAFVRDQAMMQLLGVHASIRRYHWEHDGLPANLEALKAGRLSQNPFTGKLFDYHVTGPATYDLTCNELAAKGQ